MLNFRFGFVPDFRLDLRFYIGLGSLLGLNFLSCFRLYFCLDFVFDVRLRPFFCLMILGAFLGRLLGLFNMPLRLQNAGVSLRDMADFIGNLRRLRSAKHAAVDFNRFAKLRHEGIGSWESLCDD